MIEHIIKFPDQYNFTLIGTNVVHVFSFPGLKGDKGDIGCIVKFFNKEIVEGENSIEFISDFPDSDYEVFARCFNSEARIEFEPLLTQTESGFSFNAAAAGTIRGIAIKQGL
jgi:hypothetical protein